MSSMDAFTRNYAGHPENKRSSQERQRIGFDISSIPAQKKLEAGRFRTSFKYKLGRPLAPQIYHDKGHLVLPQAAPTAADYAALIKWKSMASVAEAVRPDLVDALGAYNHFLNGNGAPRIFSYERYVSGDISGRITAQNAVRHIQIGAVDIWIENGEPDAFSLSGPAIPCGATTNSYPDATLFPYPETENWQKAIGAHTIWMSGNVNVVKSKSGIPHFYLIMTLHAEDMYNFNPGQSDIRTGIADNVNGRFTQTRLAHPYLNTATLVRSICWQGVMPAGMSSLAQSKSRRERERQPSDNNRLRNRI